MKSVTENFYVDFPKFQPYTPKSSLKSLDMRLVTRERCYRKIRSAVKQKNTDSPTFKGICCMYPYVSGEFKPLERHKKRDEPAGNGGGNGRDELGRRHKSLQLFISSL